MLYTIRSVTALRAGNQHGRRRAAPIAGRGCLRGSFMRTAILSVLFAVILTATPQQDPLQPNSEHPRSQQKPADPPLSVLCAPDTTFQLGVAYNSAVIASGG